MSHPDPPIQLTSMASAAERMFPILKPEQIERVASHGRIHPVQVGDVLVEAGAQNTRFFVVRTGRLEIIRPPGTDKQFVAALGPGQFTGETSVALDAQGFIKTGPDLSHDDLAAAHWPLTRMPSLLETTLPGVFAVGDVRAGNIKRVASAVGEGSIAISLVHPLPALQADLQATLTDVQWVIEAYALFLGALILVGGSMGDQFGRKRVFLFGVVFFTVASVACGIATSPGLLIIGRALQGIGAAFLVPGSLAIISATFDDAERGRAIGTWSGFSAITTAIGPVTGGWLVEHVSWRAVFFLNVPLAVMVLVLSLRFMSESRDPSRTTQIDWSGAALAVLGLGGTVFGLLEWPPLGVRDPLVIGALAIGVCSLILLFIVERRVRNPMLPLALFRSRPFAL